MCIENLVFLLKVKDCGVVKVVLCSTPGSFCRLEREMKQPKRFTRVRMDSAGVSGRPPIKWENSVGIFEREER